MHGQQNIKKIFRFSVTNITALMIVHETYVPYLGQMWYYLM